jgi:transcriptional regulator with XRE-family HTH domain
MDLDTQMKRIRGNKMRVSKQVLDSSSGILESLKLEREKTGMTSYELSAKIGVSQPSVRNAELMNYSPRLETVIAMAHELGYELVLIKKEE